MTEHSFLDRPYRNTCNQLCEVVSQKKREKFVYPEIRFAGVKEDFDVWLGKRMLFSILGFIIGALLPWVIIKYYPIVDLSQVFFIESLNILVPVQLVILSISLAIFFGVTIIALFYLHLYYVIEARSAIAELVLPDFLMLVANNLNSGMTPFAAFRDSARKEFGPLSEEIKYASAKSLGAQSFTGALGELNKRIKSEQLEETISFFSQALRSGGHLSKLLETTANDLRQKLEMKKELISATRMYVIFVIFVVVIATPVLLAISVQFLAMISSIQLQSAGGSSGFASMGFLDSELDISADFMVSMAYLLLAGSSILSSAFVGVLSSGKAKMGLKYVPLLLIASLIVFSIAGTLLSGFLG